MWNYRNLISQNLHSLAPSVKLCDDPNIEINRVVRKKLSWFPPYLAIAPINFYMFIPFLYSSFIDDNEAKLECGSAFRLAEILSRKGKSAKVIFITRQIEDTKALERFKFKEDYSILHAEVEPSVLQIEKIPPSRFSSHIIGQPLHYLSQCTNLKGSIAKIVKDFSKSYIKSSFSGDEEFEAIRSFIDHVVDSDKRFQLDSHNLQFMKTLERLLSENSSKLRDHFFHACNTMLIGFQIIDKFYPQIQAASAVYGEDINIEFIWAITALYHDVGYPVSLQSSIICETFDCQDDSSLAEACAVRDRRFFWDSKFAKGARVLDDLFRHTTSSSTTPWKFDGFARESITTPFHTSLQSSFVDYGSHGANGALLLMTFIDKHIRTISTAPDREYFYRHLALSAVSVLFHDSHVRKVFKNNGINSIKIADFPFSALLTYVDAIQDDRRDISGIVNRPDIFIDVISVDGAISAKLSKKTLAESIRTKIFNELQEALDFFTNNGISFVIPAELQRA